MRAEETRGEIKRHAREIELFGRLIRSDIDHRMAEVTGHYVRSLRTWMADLVYLTNKLIEIDEELEQLRRQELRGRRDR